MTKFQHFLFLLFISLITLGCSDDDCTKTITHPGYTMYTPGGAVHYPEQTQEIPCDAPVPEGGELRENITYLENFAWQVISFEFTADTGNNTSRLQFEIVLENQTNSKIQGVPVLTMRYDGEESTGSYSSQASSPCYEIEANSTCTLIYDQEFSLDIALIENVELVDVKYALSGR